VVHGHPAWGLRPLILVIALFCIQAPARAEPPVPQGPALQRALEGVWCNSHDGGRSCWAYDEFMGDGSFRACGQTDDDSRPFHGAGEVTIQGQTMCYVVTAASENFWLPPGQRYCTEITAMGPRTHRYRDIDTGAEFTLYRRPTTQAPCTAAR
jgi:hypothetical protein